MKNQAKFLYALLATNVKASLALRGSFFMQAAFMALNNVLFFVIWWILFDRFEEIRGWRVEDMAALYGVAAGGYGLSVVIAGGVPDIAGRIDDGDLDPMLTLPKSVLVQAACAKTRPAGWGDLASGVALVGLSGYLSPWTALAIVLSAITFTAAGIALHCVAFYARRIEVLARQAQEFLISFSVYPPTLFGSTLKLLLFTVLPAGFTAYMPVEIIRAPTLTMVSAAVGGTALYTAFAVWLFQHGLRSYTSGNRFGVRD